jgi:hypothetical protein
MRYDSAPEPHRLLMHEACSVLREVGVGLVERGWDARLDIVSDDTSDHFFTVTLSIPISAGRIPVAWRDRHEVSKI